MAVVEELIRKEEDGTLSFGNFELDTKKKLSDFEFEGDLYKVKTFKEITKLEKMTQVYSLWQRGWKIHLSPLNLNLRRNMKYL